MAHVHTVSALHYPLRHPVRLDALTQVTLEFLRTWLRFRVVPYRLTDRDQEQAVRIAELLTLHGLTPERFLAYWRNRMNDFSPSSFPSLQFLAQHGVIAEAACARARPHTPAFAETPVSPHGKLRRHLAETGIEMAGWSDRQLAIVRRLALARIQGKRVFVSKEMNRLVSATTKLLRKELR